MLSETVNLGMADLGQGASSEETGVNPERWDGRELLGNVVHSKQQCKGPVVGLLGCWWKS